jgi:DNA-binding transcriptional ArsR family regulator
MSFSAKRQQGLTFISIIFILGFIAFFVLLTLKIAPIYMNHSKVMNALTSLEEMEGVETMSKRELKQNLDKRFGMNYVNHVALDDITILKHDEYLRVDIEYERVEKIIGNLSVLVEFHDFFEMGE